ncbi:G-protein coupled receptor Mth [Folsomia candida]|uniref:G-protein coupled receptor Mth n=2 Tax=Folsomia candida TaxID=158441 RepID=A0A226D1G8_FOLCA|nr:G-protein coupled receptor Mth [Folsomia candida]
MHLATIRTIKIVSLTITSLEWVLVVMTVMVTFVVGGTPSEINLAKCQDPVASMSKTQMDVWTVPSLLMSDFSADTSFRFENQAQTCEDIVEFEIQIPQIQIDDASPAGTSHHIQIEIQNGNGWQEPSDNVTYFVSDTTELNQTIDHTNHAVDKPIATFTPTGHLFLDNEHYFRPSEYCIQSISSVTIGVKVCQPNCHSVKSLCIPICCTLGKVLYHNGTTETCVEIGGGDDNTTFEYRPTLYRDVNHKLSVEEGAQISQHFYKHMPRCAEGQVLTSYPFRRIHNILGSIVRVLSNGRVKLLLPLERKWKEFQNFCLAGLATSENGVEDNHNNADAEKPVSLRFSGSEEDQILYVCGDYASNEVGAPHFYIPVHFINSFFLFVTGLVYILLWEKQNIHGWTVLSFVLAMFFMFIFLAWSHLAAMLHKSNANPHFAPPPLVCRCVGALAHFFFLATFCWLAIINVDLWLTFKSMTPVSGRSKGVKRFICYMLFAWGTPAIIVGVGLVLTHVYP